MRYRESSLLQKLVQERKGAYSEIPEKRKMLLKQVAMDLAALYLSEKSLDITVICTHNSRRSQLAQVWLELGIAAFGLKNCHAHSGGTEATAFNQRMVRALTEKGIRLEMKKEGENPIYHLSDQMLSSDTQYFSKKYGADPNPKLNFVAIIVCDSADKACPIVFGAKKRFYLPFEDPKNYDGTKKEAFAYQAKVDEIGGEMIYLLSAFKSNLAKNTVSP